MNMMEQGLEKAGGLMCKEMIKGVVCGCFVFWLEQVGTTALVCCIKCDSTYGEVK